LAQGLNDGAALELAGILARDGQPHVRKEIAEALVHLPQDEFLRLGSVLAEDNNSLVAKAAQRAMARRQRSAKQTTWVTKKLSKVRSNYELMEQEYGRTITAKARRLASEQYDTLVGDTIHNMNNIVSPVRMAITSLHKHIEGGDASTAFIQRKLESMSRQMAYLAHFMSEMKEYAKATPVEREPELIADIVTEAIRMAKDACAANGTAVDRIEIAPMVPDHMTFPVARCQLVSALVHVLRNAIECFSPRARTPRITVAALVDAGRLTLTVTDNGPGIDPENLAVLRDFVPRKMTTKAGGTGFGLPTAYRYIVEGHDGTLAIDPAKPRGLCVTMTIPEKRSGEDGA
jgi:signal transduction histidine kinase